MMAAFSVVYHKVTFLLFPSDPLQALGSLVGDSTMNRCGEYVYMQDLHELSTCRPPTQLHIPEGVGVINTSLIADALM